MGSQEGHSHRSTGSNAGRFTFHLPNAWTRRPLDEIEDDQALNDDDEQDEGDHSQSGTMRNGLYKSVAQSEEALLTPSEENNSVHNASERFDWENDASLAPMKKGAVLFVFSILGAAVLLPFNSLITPSEYYRRLLAGSSRANAFISWILVVYNLATILIGAHATVSLHKTTPTRRICFSTATILVALLLLTLFTVQPIEEKEGKDADMTFAALLVFTFVIAAATSYLQNAVVALCSIFGGRAMGLMLAGQGLVGFLSSVVQLTAAVTKTTSASASEDLQEVSKAATVFYSFSTAFMAFSIAAFIWLARLGVYRKTCRSFETSRNDMGPNRHPASGLNGNEHYVIRLLPESSRPRARHILDIQSKIQGLSFAIFYIFTVTLAIFPALTARVISTDPAQAGWKRSFVFVAWHFVCFNGFDLLGRTLPTINPRLLIKSTRTNLIASLSRTLFIPLLLACNVRSDISDPGTGGIAGVRFPDWAFFILIALFAGSNGILATSVMVSGPASDTLSNDRDRATAGTILSFWLAAGLAMGSFASFAVGALA
ncbi:unnamed protein product [Sympodiomycopsis kandeliae]